MIVGTAANPHEKLYGLDHLRALAILLVFLYHYQVLSGGQPVWLTGLAKFGWTGVDLFFVLSGFLIASQLFFQIRNGQKISFKTFFLKRFLRILPAFWVVLGIYYCFPFFHEKEALPPVWKFLTFTQNLGLNQKDFGTFSHAWSLCVEEHFYFLLPGLLILLQPSKYFKKSYWLLIALFLSGFVIRMYCYDKFYLPLAGDVNSRMYWFKYIYYPTYTRLDGLLAGVAIAGIYQFLPAFWNRISKYGNLFIAAGLLMLTGAYFLCSDKQSYHASVWGFPLVALGYGMIVIGAISPTAFLYRWNSKLTTFVATLSYAMYLTHKGIYHMTHELLAPFGIDSNLLFLTCILTCTLGAFLLHLVIEKPFMRLRNRIRKKAQRPGVMLGI